MPTEQLPMEADNGHSDAHAETELTVLEREEFSSAGYLDMELLRFTTAGSVDDGKSTLIGRLLYDSKSIFDDQYDAIKASSEKRGEEHVNLALLTDGLRAEREQGITIDVAYRYFATPGRKFIIGDAPGHEQYTRNMVTAASSADAAVVLVDATKLQWRDANLALLPQTRRHTLLVNLLRVPSIVFAVNKLDAVEDATIAFANISAALAQFAQQANIAVRAVVPISALQGLNVVAPMPGWAGYTGASLLQVLEGLEVTSPEAGEAFAFPVQWVEKFPGSSETKQGRRVFWGRVAASGAQVGREVQVMPSGQTAVIAQVLNHVRQPADVPAGHSAGIVLDREVDVSRGDWLLEPGAHVPTREISATVAWLDDEPLVAGRAYWALQGHRWVKARIKRIVHKLDIETLAEGDADHLEPNAIGHVEITLQEPLPVERFSRSRLLGSLVLVDTATHKTSGAVLVR